MAEKVILAEQDLSFGESGIEGLYLWQAMPSAVTLTEGEDYIVHWDGKVFPCTATAASFNGVDGLGLGNFALAGLGENTEEPFLMGAAIDGSFSACYTTESDATNTVAIYQTVEEEEPEEPAEGIVLKDRNGKDVAYYGIETVTFDTTTEGKQQTYTKGVKEDKTVALDMAAGDLVIEPEKDKLFGKVTVTKPETMTTENIRSGVEIGGVVGDFIGDTEETTVPLSMAEGDQVIEPSDALKVLSRVTVQKPETLIPENIKEGVDIAGIIGELSGDGLAAPELKYCLCQIDTVAKTIVIHRILYDQIYADTGSYDVTIPDVSGYSVYINASGV